MIIYDIKNVVNMNLNFKSKPLPMQICIKCRWTRFIFHIQRRTDYWYSETAWTSC